MAKSKAKAKKQGGSFFLLVVMVAFAIFFAVSIVSSAKVIKDKKAENDIALTEYNELIAENEEYQNIIDNGDKDEYIEKLAREKYGYIKPGDRVYQDIASGE